MGVKYRVEYGVGLLLFIAGPAFAQANCDRPIPPVAPNGRTASQADITAAIGDAKRFIKLSDVYQQCLVDYVNGQRKKAEDNKTTFDKSIEAGATRRIDENQADKVQVGKDINSASALFRASHSE